VIIERPVDCGRLYDTERRGLIALVRSLPDAERHRTVPATPAWTVRDVVAHVVGITADLNAGRFGPDAPDAWTAQQVAARRDRSIDDLAREWDTEAPTFCEGLALFGYEMGSHFLGDLVQHVADVHHALGRPRRPDDDEALVVATDFYLDSFHRSLLDAAVGTVVAVVDAERWELGAGKVVAEVRAGRFELFRALGGRRSAAQIRSLAWIGDVDRVAELVSRYGVPATDLVEP
jgi:uncharacterized protein (TIGR03083 family)